MWKRLPIRVNVGSLWIGRHLLAVGIVVVALIGTAAIFVFARPQYQAEHHAAIKIPAKQPAADAAGVAGWKWPDGVPGWVPGYTVGGFNVSMVQPIETQPAALAAAHTGLDASQVRVVDAEHVLPGEGPLAILAAPVYESTPTTACLAVALPASDAVRWRCPGVSRPNPDYASSRVLLGVVTHPWPGQGLMFALVGVARGDVSRVTLYVPGHPNQPGNRTLYQRGTTWGQFESNLILGSTDETPELRIYGDHGLVQTIRLPLSADEQRVVG